MTTEPTARELALATRSIVSRYQAEIGRPNVCVEASTLVRLILGRFGYQARLLAVTALFCEIQHERALFRSTISEGGDASELQRRFVTLALGAYDDSVTPVAGVSRLPGLITAAHVVVLVEQPRLLVDLTADQLSGRGLGFPAVICAAVERHFPEPVGRAIIREHGLFAIYDWIQHEQDRLPSVVGPSTQQLDALVKDVRALVARR